MHRCSIEVTDVGYVSLCNPRTIRNFLLDIARHTRSLTKDEPQIWMPPAQQLEEQSEFWTVALAPRGWITVECYLTGEDKGTFTLDICSVNPVEKRRILPVIDAVLGVSLLDHDAQGASTAR